MTNDKPIKITKKNLCPWELFIIPYAMNDYATTFATLSLDEVLAAVE
jgi:hypothetical protein